MQKNTETVKNNDELEDVLDFTKPDYEFKPKEHHEWRQQGYYLVCKSCECQHATWIGPEKVMVGMNEQGPIFKTRKELNM